MVVASADFATTNTHPAHNTNQEDTQSGHGSTRSAEGGGGGAAGARPSSSDTLGGHGSTSITDTQGQNGVEIGGHDEEERDNLAAPALLGDAQGRRISRRAQENKRKTALKVATLNINGFGNLVCDHADNKWGRIYRMMSDQRIGVLLLQETHLTKERVADIHRMFACKIKIFFSSNQEAPTQREGVAVVLNCRYLNVTNASAKEIVPGRAIQVTIQGPGGGTRRILCVYAPTSNGVSEQKLFFKEVGKYYEDCPEHERPHLMAGDFNNVEDAVDRLPISEGPDSSISALDDLKGNLGLMLADGWRVTYPHLRDYTFHRGSGQAAVFSRLDRIYVMLRTASPVLFISFPSHPIVRSP